MALSIVPTPIGNPKDITLRAIDRLKDADLIIAEEFKESSRNLRALGIKNKHLEQLNEHSTSADLKRLVELCKSQKVALVSDSGTPGFCDPGNELVRLCRLENIQIEFLPGASSLMTLLSATGIKIPQFYFRGFLPAKNSLRKLELEKLKSYDVPIILMDTPYRMRKILNELAEEFPNNTVLFGVNLTQENEFIMEGKAIDVLNSIRVEKGEFLLILYP